MVPPANSALDPSSSALEHLVDRFRDYPDFRIYYGVPGHALVDILVIAICAVIGNANSWLAVQRFADSHESWFRSFLSLERGIPSHDTFRRVFQLLDPIELQRRFAVWVHDISDRLPSSHIAIDGKTLRGSDDSERGLSALHMVHAFATEQGICLAQQATTKKSNEITAIPELLRLLELRGALVTIDAMGCQTEIADQIVAAGGDYLLTVKGNQQHLHEDVQAIFEEAVKGKGVGAATSMEETEEQNRGRREKRTCYTTSQLEGIRNRERWQNLRTAGMIVSERESEGKVEKEIRYFISSREMGAEEMLKGVRDHWKIENGLHWVLDVVFGEDDHQLQSGHGPANFTTLRKLAHALIKNSKPKHGIKGTREMAGWDLRFLEKILLDAAVPPLFKDA